MKRNFLFLIVLFLSFIAFCTGAFYEASMEGPGKTQLIDLLSNYYMAENSYTFLDFFLPKVKTIFFTCLVLFLCPIMPIFAVLSPLISIIKGLSLGFCATMLIESFGYKGVWLIILSILPQCLLQLPLICLLTVFSMDLSVYIFKLYTQPTQRKKNKNALLMIARHYVLVFIFSFILLLITCLFEVFLMQFLL